MSVHGLRLGESLLGQPKSLFIDVTEAGHIDSIDFGELSHQLTGSSTATDKPNVDFVIRVGGAKGACREGGGDADRERG